MLFLFYNFSTKLLRNKAELPELSVMEKFMSMLVLIFSKILSMPLLVEKIPTNGWELVRYCPVFNTNNH